MLIINLFRKGIFMQHTARFGKVAEIMIKKKFNLLPPFNNKYDLLDGVNNQRIEVKFSTVKTKASETINESNILEKCITAKWQNQPIKYEECRKKVFDRNIEQVKPTEFDILYYGLFFWDRILIFQVDTGTMSSLPGWSDKMHLGKAGNYVEGQFHINNENVQYHIEHHLVDTLSYEQLYDLVNPYESTCILICSLLKEIRNLWKH